MARAIYHVVPTADGWCVKHARGPVDSIHPNKGCAIARAKVLAKLKEWADEPAAARP